MPEAHWPALSKCAADCGSATGLLLRQCLASLVLPLFHNAAVVQLDKSIEACGNSNK